MTLEDKLIIAKKKKNIDRIEEVFYDIYQKYYSLVGYIISKYVSKKEDIEELINDCFIKLSKAIMEKDILNIKNYLVTIAKNESINYIKKITKGIELVYCDEYVYNEPYVDNSGGYYNLICEMEKTLNSREINIILLHDVYGYSFKDIATKYVMPLSTISSIYRRALNKFKKEVK